MQRSHLNIELEQRCINQSVRDINTFLKVLLDHKESSPIQKGQLSQTAQTSVQNEMEIKLLRQERKALSSSIAEVNVERRKLTEEKLYLEREKMEFERERVRVRDAETLSNVRLAEADSLKRVNYDLSQFISVTEELDLLGSGTNTPTPRSKIDGRGRIQTT